MQDAKIKNNDKTFTAMPNLQTNHSLKLDIQKVEQQRLRTGGKCLILNTKHHEDSHLLSLELPCNWKSKFYLKESDGNM